MKRYMLITVGTGRYREDIAKAILISINDKNPDRVIFFCTDKSKEETIPFIEKDYKNFEVVILKDENDLEAIKQKCDEVIEKLKREDAYIVVDYTSGTKAMSAGIILSAIENEVNYISYIAGSRDESGRVIPGTERILSFPPNRIYRKRFYREGIRYFNNYLFESAKKIFENVSEFTSEKDSILKKSNLLIKLCDAYSNWDLFNHKEALEILKSLPEEEKTLLAGWGVRSKVEKHKELLYKINSSQFSVEMALDLFKNAERRFSEGRYDDCVARLYRLLEYIIQFRMAEKDLYVRSDNIFDTSKIDLSRIPDHLKDRYCKPAGLEASAELLKELNDDTGIEICNSEELKGLLSARNSSILAHGFIPIKKETAEDFLNLMRNFIRKMQIPKFEDTYKNFEFLQIRDVL